MNNLLRFVFFGLLLVAHARGQEDAVPPPQAPFIHLPERAAWQVQVSDSRAPTAPAGTSIASGPAARHLMRVDSEKIGDLKRDFLVYSDGSRDQVWYRGGYRLIASSDGRFATVLAPHDEEAVGLSPDSVYDAGVPCVGWIRASDYQKPVRQGSTLCYFFERKDQGAVAGQAWIDIQTGLPVLVRVGTISYQFTFMPSADDALTLPSPYAEAWDRFAKLEARRRLLAHGG